MAEGNKNKIVLKSINFNKFEEQITEGRLCYSRSFSSFKHVDLNSIYHQEFFSNDIIKENKLGQFIFQKKIGQGTFGKVILAKDELTEEKVAIKILDKKKILKETSITKLEREIKILKLLRHDNIVHLFNVIETNSYLYLIMEYIKGIELFDYINTKHLLNENEACKFFQQIISGIEYLGKIKVTHRDLKPENLLISNNGIIKIVDFGLSNTYFENNLLSTACGSPCYAPPEMVRGKKYSGISADIWSSGVVLYAMLCGSLPFEDNDNDKLYKKISEGKFLIPQFLSEYAVDFLQGILKVDPDKRFTIEQIKSHPWFNQLNPKIYMSEGLLINKVVVPIDEKIVFIMVDKYKFNEEEVKINLLLNEHNQITTTYYLILQKIIKSGKNTIGDMKSDNFVKYINDERNQLSYYDNNLNLVIEERVYGKKLSNRMQKKNIRQISETKIIKKHFLLDSDLVNNRNILNNNKSIIGQSAKINNYNIINNKEKNPNENFDITYINYSNRKNYTNSKEKSNNHNLNNIYIKKSSKSKKNSRNNNNFYISFNKNKKNINKIFKKQNLSFHKSDKFLNILLNNRTKSLSKKNNINKKNTIKLEKKYENNKFINVLNGIKNFDTDLNHKFLFNKKLLSITNKIKHKINSSIKNNINKNRFFTKEKNNSFKNKSYTFNRNTISVCSSFNCNNDKLYSYRSYKKNKINNKKIKTNLYKIKVDKTKLIHNPSNNSYIKELFIHNKINNTFNSIKNNLNEKLNLYSKKSYTRNKKNKINENSLSNNNIKILNLDKFDNEKSIDFIKNEKNTSVYSKEKNNINYKEESNIYKKIKIQKSPISKPLKNNNNDKIYFRKNFLKRNKNFQKNQDLGDNYIKKFFDTSVNFYKMKESINKNDSNNNKTIEIKEYYNSNKASNKDAVNKTNKSLKINIISNYSNNKHKQKFNNMNIMNTIQPKKRFSDYFHNNIRKKNILINEKINNNSNIRSSINKINNFTTLYKNLNDISEYKYIKNKFEQNSKNKGNKSLNKINNDNKKCKQPQLCITNINFYNYVHNVNPFQKINSNINYTYLTNPKEEKISDVPENNKIKQKNENSKLINYIPFDLNSILLTKKINNIKSSIIKILKFKKINYKLNNNTKCSIKFNCNKNDIRFEIAISVGEENYLDKGIFIINAIKKQGNSINFKNILNQIIKSLK